MNFRDYLNRQKAEDRRAFIIYARACGGKTAFARRVCGSRKDVHLLDLQDYFLGHPELPSIAQMNPKRLELLLLNLPADVSVIIVDNMDFLFNTWQPDQKQEFLNWLRVRLRSPSVTPKTFVFFLQDDPALEAAEMASSYGASRIRPLGDFDAL